MQEFIHEIDEEQYNTLKEMLSSSDMDTVNMAVDIMNLCNVKDVRTFDLLCQLIKETKCAVTFDVEEKDWTDNKWDSFKFYIIEQYTNKLKSIW